MEDRVKIRRPLPDVFAFLCDLEHLPAWAGGVKRASRTSPEPIGVGTTYRVVAKLAGRRVEATYELTAFEPDVMFSLRMTSPVLCFDQTYRFGSEEGMTTVHLTAEVEPQGWLKLLGPVLAVGLPRQVQADHGRLRKVLEKRPRATAGGSGGGGGSAAPA